MFIYSVTLHISKDAESEWLQFMQQKHLADVLKTGYFTKASMRKAAGNKEQDSSTYNMEYLTESIEKYNDYIQHAAPPLQNEVVERFSGKFTAERMLYEVVAEL